VASNRFSVAAVFSAVDKVTAPVSRMQNSVLRFSRSAERSLKSVDRAMGKVTGGLNKALGVTFKAGAAGIGALGAAALFALNAFSKIENAEAYFTPLLGGAERAKEMVAALNKTAASTPFQFESLAGAAGQLLPVMNGDIERTIATMRMLGDTAGGNAQKLDSVARGFTKAMLKGKVDMESLNMIAEAGVPIFDDLAAVMGMKTGEKFFKAISAGKVTTDALEKAFQRLTGEGGKFYKGMETASLTLSGKWSTLMDNITLTAAAIGEQLTPEIKGLMDKVIGLTGKVQAWVTANKELIKARLAEFLERAKASIVDLYNRIVEYNKTHDIMSKVISAFETITKVIIFLGTHGGKILAIVTAIYGLAAAVKIAKIGMIAFNFVVGLNPILLLAAGILSAGAAIGYFVSQIEWVDRLVGKLLEKLPALGFLDNIAAKFMVKEDTDAKSRADEQVARLNEIRANKKRQVISPAQQTAAQMSEHTERSVVDVNFNNAPAGTGIKQSGAVPGVNTRVGFSGAY
jgi:tape measure domain-containing protein